MMLNEVRTAHCYMAAASTSASGHNWKHTAARLGFRLTPEAGTHPTIPGLPAQAAFVIARRDQRLHHRLIAGPSHLYYAVELEMHDDEAAIEQAHRIHLQSSGGGFEVWQGNRLVYNHRR
jgi:hypothetical protein